VGGKYTSASPASLTLRNKYPPSVMTPLPDLFLSLFWQSTYLCSCPTPAVLCIYLQRINKKIFITHSNYYQNHKFRKRSTLYQKKLYINKTTWLFYATREFRKINAAGENILLQFEDKSFLPHLLPFPRSSLTALSCCTPFSKRRTADCFI
jgi:hypothetical protein